MFITPKISVIVPVYNAEKWLQRCVDSILAQTFTEFELLLIDDGSTDKSLDICKNYAKNDTRIKVVHKNNGGVSSARNLGLDKASGKYVTFVDADDWVGTEYLNNLVSAAEKETADLVINYAEVYLRGKGEKENYPEQLIENNDYTSLFLQNDLIWHTSPWSKLFKLETIRKSAIKFPDNIHIGEDAIFLYDYLLICKRIKVICTCDYNYQADCVGSLTKRINNFVSERAGYERLKEISVHLKKKCNNSKEIDNKFGWLTGSYHRRCLIAMYHDKVKTNERRSYLKNEDFSDYLDCITENSRQGKIYQILLRWKQYFMYDSLRMLISKIQKWNIQQ